jgi:hypothetical protein
MKSIVMTITGDNQVLKCSEHLSSPLPANILIENIILRGYRPGKVAIVRQGVIVVEFLFHEGPVDISTVIFCIKEDGSNLATYIPTLPLGMYFPLKNPHLELIVNGGWQEQGLNCIGKFKIFTLASPIQKIH